MRCPEFGIDSPEKRRFDRECGVNSLTCALNVASKTLSKTSPMAHSGRNHISAASHSTIIYPLHISITSSLKIMERG
jgi:hypothetical protein